MGRFGLFALFSHLTLTSKAAVRDYDHGHSDRGPHLTHFGRDAWAFFSLYIKNLKLLQTNNKIDQLLDHKNWWKFEALKLAPTLPKIIRTFQRIPNE